MKQGYKIILSNQDAWDFGCIGGKNEAMLSCMETGFTYNFDILLIS